MASGSPPRMASKLQKMRMRFMECDIDGDSKLNESEFQVFAKKALGLATVAPDMFATVCGHCGGVDALEWHHLEPLFGGGLKTPKPKAKSKSKTASGSRPITPTPKTKKPRPAAIRTAAGGRREASISVTSSKSLSRKGDSSSPPASDRRPVAGISKVKSRVLCGARHSTQRSGGSLSLSTGSWADATPVLSDIDERRMSPPHLEQLSSDVTLPEIRPLAGGRSHVRTSSGPRLTVETAAGGGGKALSKKGETRRDAIRRSRSLRGSLSPRSSAVLSPRSPRLSGKPAMRHMRSATTSLADLGADAVGGESSAILQMLESKLTTSQKEVQRERSLRRQLEQMSAEVVAKNDSLSAEVRELKEAATRKLALQKKERSHLDAEIAGLRQRLDSSKDLLAAVRLEQRTLEAECQSASADREQAYAMFRKADKNFKQQLAKMKKAHDSEMQRVTVGVVQTLALELDVETFGGGEETAVDLVIDAIRQLRQRNAVLQKQADLLAETLSRKEQSLFEALKAVDDITHFDHLSVDGMLLPATTTTSGDTVVGEGEGARHEHDEDEHDHEEEGVMPLSLGSGRSRHKHSRKSSLFKRLTSIRFRGRKASVPAAASSHLHGSEESTSVTSSHSAAFYKGAHATHDSRLAFEAGLVTAAGVAPLSPARGRQDMAFLSQSLAVDVVAKQDKIDNISVANGVLIKQVHELQLQLTEMRRMQATALSSMRASAEAPAVDDYKYDAEEDAVAAMLD